MDELITRLKKLGFKQENYNGFYYKRDYNGFEYLFNLDTSVKDEPSFTIISIYKTLYDNDRNILNQFVKYEFYSSINEYLNDEFKNALRKIKISKLL